MYKKQTWYRLTCVVEAHKSWPACKGPCASCCRCPTPCTGWLRSEGSQYKSSNRQIRWKHKSWNKYTFLKQKDNSDQIHPALVSSSSVETVRERGERKSLLSVCTQFSGQPKLTYIRSSEKRFFRLSRKAVSLLWASSSTMSWTPTLSLAVSARSRSNWRALPFPFCKLEKRTRFLYVLNVILLDQDSFNYIQSTA